MQSQNQILVHFRTTVIWLVLNSFWLRWLVPLQKAEQAFITLQYFQNDFNKFETSSLGQAASNENNHCSKKSAKTVAATIMLVTGQFVTRKHFQQQIWGVYSLIHKTCNWFWIIHSKKGLDHSANPIDKPREWKRGRMSREKYCKKIAIWSQTEIICLSIFLLVSICRSAPIITKILSLSSTYFVFNIRHHY